MDDPSLLPSRSLPDQHGHWVVWRNDHAGAAETSRSCLLSQHIAYFRSCNAAMRIPTELRWRSEQLDKPLSAFAPASEKSRYSQTCFFSQSSSPFWLVPVEQFKHCVLLPNQLSMVNVSS